MLLTTAPHPVELRRHLVLMSHPLDIDQFVIKVNAKKITTFRPLRGQFRVRLKKTKLSINILQTVKIGKNVMNAKM